MTNHDGANFNHWDMMAEPRAAVDTSRLIIKTIKGVKPLDDQFGIAPMKTVPDALYDPIFGQPTPTEAEVEAARGNSASIPILNTYAILDAAKVPNLPELLSNSDLEHRCLFKGQAFDDLKDVAPWIVKLEENNRFTRHLFTHDPENPAPWYLWDTEPGIYIRSQANLDELWKHFRKFTKFNDQNGKSFFFRFSDPVIANTYMQNIAAEAERYSVFMCTNSGEAIRSVICCNAEGSANIFQQTGSLPKDVTRASFFLHQSDLEAFEDVSRQRQVKEIVVAIRHDFADQTQKYKDDELHIITTNVINRMQHYGFQRRQTLQVLATWEAVYGPDFETKDPEKTMQIICDSDKSEATKFKEIQARLGVLHEKGLL